MRVERCSVIRNEAPYGTLEERAWAPASRLTFLVLAAACLLLAHGLAGCGEESTGNDEPVLETCGDGVVDPGEDCDGDDLAGATCEDLGHYGGVLGCTEKCLFDVSLCYGYCGDGVMNGPEECDGDDLGGLTCRDLGYTDGELACTEDCMLDDSGCASCGGDERVCDDECVDVSRSTQHCGACGVSCFPRQDCVDGNCVGHSALSPEELLESLEDKDFLLLNVRVPPWGWIPGTDANVSDEEPDQLVEVIGPDVHSRVVVYCRTNPRSINAINQLRERGYTGICYLRGGVEAWMEAGYDLD